MKKRLIIIGASAMGRSAFHSAEETGLYDVAGFLDSRPNILDAFPHCPKILAAPENYQPQPGDHFICAVGDSLPRQKYVEQMKTRGGVFVSIVHPSAYIGADIQLGTGCIVCPGAVLTCDGQIGDHVIINVCCSISHDATIKDFVTLSPSCALAGRCTLKQGAFLGIGVHVAPDVTIGEHAIVGAGATVIRDIPANAVAVGCPAKVIRTFQ